MCLSSLDGIETFDGNAGGADCLFPFIYNGKAYFSCTTEDADPEFPWCETVNPGTTGNCATSKYSNHWLRVFFLLNDTVQEMNIEPKGN